MFLAESPRQLGASSNSQKITRWWIFFFFRNPYCWFILEQFWTSLTKPATLSRDNWQFFILEHYKHVRYTWPHQKKLHDQIEASMDILIHETSKLSISNSFWDIKIWKLMQSDWSTVFSITTQELDFPKPCIFYIFSKLVYHLNSKNHIDGPNLSSRFALPIFFRALRPCLIKLKEN